TPTAGPFLPVPPAVIYPLSYAFARRDLDRPTSLMGAISAALDEPDEHPTSYSMVARFCLWVGAAFGALVGLLVVLGAIQSISGRGLAAAAAPQLFMIAFFVAWTGLAVWVYAAATWLAN